MNRPGYLLSRMQGRICRTGQNCKSVQEATSPYDCLTFCYNRLRSGAAARPAHAQVVLGELVLYSAEKIYDAPRFLEETSMEYYPSKLIYSTKMS